MNNNEFKCDELAEAFSQKDELITESIHLYVETTDIMRKVLVQAMIAGDEELTMGVCRYLRMMKTLSEDFQKGQN